ncbi:MAG: hypothetical protein QOE83_2378 [Actinomycetota bacterium]|jgi:fructoselysine-6-P-deglycase FrlB-like protein|nr:hypothetical protein [Actinomycetota bacterium]
MSETAHEIASQPACWRRAVTLASTASASLPQRGERVAMVGCGTSWFIGQAYAALREAAGQGHTDAFAASEYPPNRTYDRVVALSRSGTTTEVERLLRGLPPEAVSIAITAVPGTPIPDAAGLSVSLEFADETSVVQTRFATTALALLRAHLGEDLSDVIAEGERAIEEPLPVEVAAFDHFVFLGHGWSVGLANEAALKMREAAQAHTEAYPAMEYRHGPVSVAGPTTLVWILGTGDPGVAVDIRTTGATVVEPTMDPMAELVRTQRAAVALAGSRGLDPDHPKHLTRSVVLS